MIDTVIIVYVMVGLFIKMLVRLASHSKVILGVGKNQDLTFSLPRSDTVMLQTLISKEHIFHTLPR